MMQNSTEDTIFNILSYNNCQLGYTSDKKMPCYIISFSQPYFEAIRQLTNKLQMGSDSKINKVTLDLENRRIIIYLKG